MSQFLSSKALPPQQRNKLLPYVRYKKEEQQQGNERILVMYKYFLSCNSCAWNISYCESSGLLDVSEEYVNCPICKTGRVASSKHLL